MKFRRDEIARGALFGFFAAFAFDSMAVQAMFIVTSALCCVVVERVLFGGVQ